MRRRVVTRRQVRGPGRQEVYSAGTAPGQEAWIIALPRVEARLAITALFPPANGTKSIRTGRPALIPIRVRLRELSYFMLTSSLRFNGEPLVRTTILKQDYHGDATASRVASPLFNKNY